MAEIENFEVETQLLGTSPVVFVDAVINAINDYSYDACESLLKQLLATDPKLDKVELRKAIDALLNFLQDKIDKYFDKFELFCLTNVMRVPKHVKLPTDMPEIDPDDTLETAKTLEVEAEELKSKIEQGRIALRNMEREEAALTLEEQEIASIREWLGTVKKVAKKAQVTRPNEVLKMIVGDLKDLTPLVKSVNETKRKLVILAGKGEPSSKRRRRQTKSK